MSKRIGLFAAATVLAVFDARHPVLASGYFLQDQSAMYEGAALAGAVARADDPATLYWNPAGMSDLPGYQFSSTGSVINPTAYQDSATATRSGLVGGSTITGTVKMNTVPSALLPSLFATVQVAPEWHVGLSLTSPYGLMVHYPTTSVDRYYALTTQYRTYNIAPAISWQVTPKISLGAALNIEIASAYLSNSLDFGSIGAAAGLAPYGLTPGSADGTGAFNGNDNALGYQLGALFQATPTTRIGIGFRSAIDHKLQGTSSYQNVPGPLQSTFTTSSASAKVPEPAYLTVGAAQDIGRWKILGDFAWTHWSSFQSLNEYASNGINSLTQMDWRNTWTVALGTDYRINDQWTVRAGTAFEQTPTVDGTRSPRVPDANRYWLSTGVSWKPFRNVTLSAAYAHVFANSTSVDLTDGGPGTDNFMRGNLSASYSGNINIFTFESRVVF